MRASATQKKKTCAICGEQFPKQMMGQKVCGVDCAIAYSRKQLAKKAAIQEQAKRKEIRVRKEKLKTRSDWMKEAQTAFNAFIRERDKGELCICCSQPLTLEAVGGGYDCGHYRSTGSAPHLRFDERNAHAQRKVCNRYGAGRAVDYRIGLIARIGLEAVEALEADNEPRKYTIDQLKEIRDTYRAKLRDLQKGGGLSMIAEMARSKAEIDLSGTIAALQDWADWTRAYTGAERIGHANHCAVSCSPAGNSWQDFEDSVNRFRNDCVEAVVDDLAPAQQCAINHCYLDAVFRFPRGNYDDLLQAAHIRVRQELIRKGVVV